MGGGRDWLFGSLLVILIVTVTPMDVLQTELLLSLGSRSATNGIIKTLSKKRA